MAGLPVERLYVSPNRDNPEGSVVGAGGLPIDWQDQEAQSNLAAIQAAQAQQNPTVEIPTKDTIIQQLLGTGKDERYQLWPEKLIRDAITAPRKVLDSKEPLTSQDLIKPALDMSALAGTGGLAGVGESAGTSLGAGPFLRPALKYEGKIYKAPIGGEHMDAIPENLRPEFTKQAMSGEDISNFDFGFMNHKGQFLSREKALKYAIDEGLLSPQDAKYGALTSTLMADSSKEAAAIDAVSKQPFYSAAEKAVEAIPQAKMTGQQWLGTIANKPGVKPEELDWTGLKDFLASKGKEPVTKEQIQGHLADNAVQLKDVIKGNVVDETAPAFNKKVEEILATAKANNKPMMRSRAEDLAFEQMGFAPTKYHSYQLPGGENYREHLLTLPDPMKEYNSFIKDIRSKYGEGGINKLPLTKAERARYEKVLAGAEGVGSTYKSSHWDEPNILAHVRTNERDVAGKPSLHIEELQSDWHQAGRKKGYSDPAEIKRKQNELKNKISDVVSQRAKFAGAKDAEGLSTYKQLHEKEVGLIDEYNKLRDLKAYSVPNAPFKTSWPELAMKRMIRLAAEEGKDRVSWTPGEAQAARYNLSKDIDRVVVFKGIYQGEPTKVWNPITKSGTYVESITSDTSGKIIRAGRMWGDIEGKTVEEVFGKDTAKKGLESDLREKTIQGLDLKVGGEGMKGFYDQMLPKMVEKLGKKYDVKVKEGKTDFIKGGNGPNGWVDPNGWVAGAKSQPVLYFDIPPKMKEDVLKKGFSLFSNPLPIPAQRDK